MAAVSQTGIFLIFLLENFHILIQISLICLTKGLIGSNSVMVSVVAWWYEATNHYLNQCRPNSITPHEVTMPLWVKRSNLLTCILRLAEVISAECYRKSMSLKSPCTTVYKYMLERNNPDAVGSMFSWSQRPLRMADQPVHPQGRVSLKT